MFLGALAGYNTALGPGKPKSRWFFGIAGVLLAVMAAAQITAALQESPTWDEAGHLVAGYAVVKAGDYRFSPDHPPLGRMIDALPLLALGPRLPATNPSDQPGSGHAFLYENTVRAETLLFAARAMNILLTLLLGAVLGWWTRRLYGGVAGLVTLFLFSTDPNFIAHGHYVTTDLIAAAGIFLACIAWGEYLRSERNRDLTLAGLALGVALAGKFSTIVLIPTFAVLYAIRWWKARFPARRLLLSAGVAGIAAFAVICAVYCGAPGRWLEGVRLVVSHNSGGHPSYLLGQFSSHGWWYYFPVAFAVKTPTAVLVLAGMALVFVRRIPYAALLTIPPAIFFGASMAGSIDIGLRHILPVYPFLFVLIGAAVVRFPRRLAACAALLLAFQAVEFVRVWPDFTAFFNTVSGGPAYGHRYLLDSNLDWGQDLLKLRRYLESRRITNVCPWYFGTADYGYYRVPGHWVEPPKTGEERARIDCVAPVSATLLYGLYVGPEMFRWLREKEPMARVGYSIYVYDLRKNQD